MNATVIQCRLCEATADFAFTCRVMDRYNVGYFRCTDCGSLQSEAPYWLDEAYAGGHLADVDAGPVVRSLESQAIVYTLARFLRMPRTASVLDIGGGNGLLCRLLRDAGFDARVSDSYAANDLARGFDDDGTTPDIITAVEVAEHLADPRSDMKGILGRGAKACVLSTDVYTGQGPDWWYINPATGQHVFFYSARGMAVLAARHGYHYERVGNWHFFLPRPLGRLADSLFWRLVVPSGRRWVRAWLAWRMTNDYASQDYSRARQVTEHSHPPST
jgi:hypothetical protein